MCGADIQFLYSNYRLKEKTNRIFITRRFGQTRVNLRLMASNSVLQISPACGYVSARR